ncbi:SpoIIE family protein phosphatase [Geodermatophilus nigrescens]
MGRAEDVRDAFEAMPWLLVALEGPEHRMVAANAVYRAFAGRSDFIGRPAREVFPDIAGQQLFELLDRVYATGEPVVAREWRLQMDSAADGPSGDLFLDFTVAPWRAADGGVRGVLITQSDVTDRVRERQASRQREAAADQRYAQARDVLAVLQHELLPPGVPILPGVDIAASYLLADADTAAGGDWFDAIPLVGGSVALVVGDVVGHGVAASAVMGQLRTVLHDRLAAGEDLPTALGHLDRYAASVRGASAATVCAAILNPTTGALAYCTAGHPPPLVVTRAGDTRLLPATGSGPLGTGTTFLALKQRLQPGDLLLAYTDGIIERPGRTPAEAAAEFEQVAADTALNRAWAVDAPARTAERVCTQVLELLVRATGQEDDITLLAAQRVAAPPPLHCALPAQPGAVRALRRDLTEWLHQLGTDADDDLAVQHAVGEVVTNAVEHAYRDRPPPDRARAVQVAITLQADGLLYATVADHGRWHDPAPEPSHRGRGLAMAGEFADRLHTDRTATGTTVTLARRLTRPARLLTGDARGGGRPAHGPADGAVFHVTVSEQPVPRVQVAGPLDADTADRLRAVLLRSSRGGTRELAVDLTEVTHLASAAVQVLHEAARRSAGAGRELQLVAPAGSTAAYVLSLVGLSHSAPRP